MKSPSRFVVLLSCCLLAVPLLSAQAPAPWVSLFNGKDLSGWSLKGGGGKAYVENGEVVCHVTANTTEHTFLTTNEMFSDFIFEIDLKIDGDFNTGISFRAVDALPGAPVKLWSYMVKVDPTSRHWTGGIFEDFGDCWQWLNTMESNAPGRESFKIGAWNRFRVEAIDSHFKVWVNGVPTANLIDDRYARGYIALKIHFTGNFPEREKILAHFKNARIITAHPERYGEEMSLPVTTTSDESGITVPPGFRALLVADNLVGGKQRPGDKLRFLAVGPNSDIYAKTVKGGILALRDLNGDSRADVIEEFGSGGGTGIAFHNGWLYHSTNSAIYRYKYPPGKLIPPGKPELIVSGLPAEGAHEAKAFAFDEDGRLLVEVASPSNGYGFPDRKAGAKGADPTGFLKTHGGFWRFDANKTNQAFSDGFHYSSGMRHAVSVAWNPVAKTFFTVMMGRDQLDTVAPQFYDALDNAERVAEELHRLDEGANFGWPFTYYDPIKQARMLSPEFGGDNRLRAERGKYPDPLVAFPAHWAPLQMAFYNGRQFPKKYRGGAFVAFHGSWNRAPMPQGGYNVCFVPFDEKGKPAGTYEVFADGFSGQNRPFTNVNDARFRPCGVAVAPDGTLYLGDTESGRIWRIIYTGQPQLKSRLAAGTPRSIGAEPSVRANDPSPGAKLYQTLCAPCHMADGGGVASMQPRLKGSSVIAADPARLIRAILEGPAAVLPADREHYQNVMPPFATLNDRDLTEIVNYLRRTFGSNPSPVSLAQIAATRLSARPFVTLALGTPRGLAVDRAGNVYVADVDLGKMHKITPDGAVRAFGGAPIQSAIGLAAAPDGAVFAVDAEHNAIYRISADGLVSELAAPSGEMRLRSPTNLAVDTGGNVFVANNLAHTILRITPTGIVSVFAGKAGEVGSSDGIGSTARFNTPLGIAVDAKGNLYVADKDNSNVRKITPGGSVSTLAGSAGRRGSADGKGATARFAAPRALAADAAGTVYVADTENHCIRMITADGTVSTLAGQAGQADQVDGTGKAARFNDPRGIAVDREGNVYVADGGNGAIRQISRDRIVTTLAAASAVVIRVQPDAPLVSPRPGQTTRFDYTRAQTLAGWDADPAYWSVKDGAFTAKGTGAPSTFLLTQKRFSDFRLTLWSQMAESDNHAGVALWGEQTIASSGKNKWAYKGPLVIFPGLSLWDYRTNKNIPVNPAGKALAKKLAGQHDWIHVEILAQGNRVRVAYNGRQVLDWREPDPSRLKTGPVGLQLHGFSNSQKVIYKGVVIETFPKEDRLITIEK